MSLDQLRVLKFFQAEAAPAQNVLTVDELANCELFITPDERLLIARKAQIVACDPTITILPTVMPGMYDHGNNRYSDVPCQGQIAVRMPLSDKAKTRSLLEYLRAVPLYKV